MTKPAADEEAITRLDAYARRLSETVAQATSLYAVFWTLNESEQGRDDLMGPLASAINVIQHALLRELILIVVRVLDKPGKLETSDKVSFVVIGHWFEREEIREALIERASNRHGDKWARRNAYVTRRAIKSLTRRLDRLATEKPNRERLLRNFRDDFVAHELHREIPRDQPLFKHIMEMINEIQALCLDALTACTGYELEFDHIGTEATEGAQQLWRAVAERQFRWHPKKGVVQLEAQTTRPRD